MAITNLTPEGLAQRLAPFEALARPWDGVVRRAAVAAVLRFDHGRPEVLLMERAVRADDRWSGQVSFPGGRSEDEDRDLLDTAIRETREELGLDLRTAGRLLGVLSPVLASARGRVLPMTITPFVFLQTVEQPLVLNDEAVATFWLPLDLAAGGTLDSTHEYRLGIVPLRFPCWRYEGHVVWGLTHGMIRSLLASVD